MKNNQGEIPSIEKRNKIIFVFASIFLITIFLATVALIIAVNKFAGEDKRPKPVVLELKQPKVKQETKPNLDKSELTFEVLNGSGVAGRAGKSAKKLQSLGFTVVKIGNASADNLKISELYIIESMSDKSDLLLEELKTDFGISTISGTLKDSTASARLIVGRE